MVCTFDYLLHNGISSRLRDFVVNNLLSHHRLQDHSSRLNGAADAWKLLAFTWRRKTLPPVSA